MRISRCIRTPTEYFFSWWTPNVVAYHNQKSGFMFSVPLMVSVSLSSFHRWKIKSHIIVTLWESWNNIYSNWTVIREKHIMNLIPFPDVKCHKEFFSILGRITGIFKTILFSLCMRVCKEVSESLPCWVCYKCYVRTVALLRVNCQRPHIQLGGARPSLKWRGNVSD